MTAHDRTPNIRVLRTQLEPGMRNAAVFLFVILAAGVLAVGQSAGSSPPATEPADLPWNMSAVTGCLQSSAGHYMLTDDEGTVHELSGGAGKLKHQVGHQVEVIGKKGTRSVDRTLAGGASSVVELPVFEVKSVKQIADKCKLPGE